MAFKPIDPKRDEFRRYLERAGVIEALTKAFVRIVKERPENPIEYLRHNLGDARQEADNVAYLQSELDEKKNEIQRLRDIIRNINPDALDEQREELKGGNTIKQMPSGENQTEENGTEPEKETNEIANANVADVSDEERVQTAEDQQHQPPPKEELAQQRRTNEITEEQSNDIVINNGQMNDENPSAPVQIPDNNP